MFTLWLPRLYVSKSLWGWAVQILSNPVLLLRTQRSTNSLRVESAGLSWNLVIPLDLYAPCGHDGCKPIACL